MNRSILNLPIIRDHLFSNPENQKLSRIDKLTLLSLNDKLHLHAMIAKYPNNPQNNCDKRLLKVKGYLTVLCDWNWCHNEQPQKNASHNPNINLKYLPKGTLLIYHPESKMRIGFCMENQDKAAEYLLAKMGVHVYTPEMSLKKFLKDFKNGVTYTSFVDTKCPVLDRIYRDEHIHWCRFTKKIISKRNHVYEEINQEEPEGFFVDNIQEMLARDKARMDVYYDAKEYLIIK